MIAIVCGLIFGIGLVMALSPWFTPPPKRSPWGPWKRLSDDVARARVPGLNAVRLIAVSFGLGVVVALSVLLATGAWPVALIVSIGVAFLPYAWVVSRVAGRAKTVRAAWPEVIDAMVSGVRAGTSLPQVLCDLADEGPDPVRFAFEAFSRDYSANGRFELALDKMKETVADPVADRIVEALRVARSVGGADRPASSKTWPPSCARTRAYEENSRPASPGPWARPDWGWPPPGSSCFCSPAGVPAPTYGTRPEELQSSSAVPAHASSPTSS